MLAWRDPRAIRCFLHQTQNSDRRGKAGGKQGKKCNKALTLTKKGTISMTMASFRSGFSMGFNRATCKEKQTQ